MDNKTQASVLVTGANGFTGSAVVRALLKNGYSVKAVILPGTDETNLSGLEIEKIYGNILDIEFMNKALIGVDFLHHVAAVFDFAADPNKDPSKYEKDCKNFYQNNLEGTTAVMLSAMRSKVNKIVYTSTMACIGTTPGEQLSNENNEYNIWLPVNDYMRSKGFAEAVVKKFIEGGLPVVIVNPTWTVGPGDINPTPVGRVIVDVIENRYPSLSPAGINIVDVDDVGMGHVLAQENGKIGERYILGGENIRYEQFLEKIARLSGLDGAPKREQIESSFPKEFLWYDSTKANSELNWNPRKIDETILRAISWFRRNGIKL